MNMRIEHLNVKISFLIASYKNSTFDKSLM